MVQYFLSQHAYVCVAGDQVIFLDLKRDQYIGLPAAETAFLAGAIKGWPIQRTAAPNFPTLPSVEQTSLIDGLIEKGLVTHNANVGKEATPAAVEPVRFIFGFCLGGRRRVGVRDVFCFIVSYIFAVFLLRSLPLDRIIRRIEKRKHRASRCYGIGSAENNFDTRAAREVVTIFRRLRPFFFFRKDTGILESLVFIEFLEKYNLFPTLTFAVTAQPFSARCWLQIGSSILNQHAEFATNFVPIMAI